MRHNPIESMSLVYVMAMKRRVCFLCATASLLEGIFIRATAPLLERERRKKARRPRPGLFTRGRAQTPPSARHMPGCLALSALSRFVLSGSLPALAGILAGVTLAWIALARPLAAFVRLLTAATGADRRGGVLGFFVLGHCYSPFGVFLRGGITGGFRGWFRQKIGGSGKKTQENREISGTYFVAGATEAVLCRAGPKNLRGAV
jgi:hypothetical protein